MRVVHCDICKDYIPPGDNIHEVAIMPVPATGFVLLRFTDVCPPCAKKWSGALVGVTPIVADGSKTQPEVPSVDPSWKAGVGG